MILSTRSVSQVGLLSWVVGFFVSATGTLTDAIPAQLESCDDITGDTCYPGHFDELEQIQEPISASDMLKSIEQSREVAESIRANEDVVCPLYCTEGRDWEGRILRLSINVVTDSVRRLRGKQRIPVVFSRVITLVWNILVGRRVRITLSIQMCPRQPSGASFSWIISNLTHPDFGTSVQLGPGSVFF